MLLTEFLVGSFWCGGYVFSWNQCLFLYTPLWKMLAIQMLYRSKQII